MIVPKGIYRNIDENPTEIEFEEEVKMPELSELTNIENWVHFHPNILNQGRVSYFLNQNLNEEVILFNKRKEKLK